MKTRVSIATASLAACLASAGVCAQAGNGASAPDREAFTLVHRFTIPVRIEWGSIAVELAPGGWRVGSAFGPPASDAQLRAVLSRLTRIEVGGHCAGWSEGLTVYPCGFAVADFDLGGLVEPRFSGLTVDWETPADAVQPNPVADRPRATPRPAAHGLISPALDAPRFVALRAPLRYLGDQSRAFGARMQFRFRCVTNALVPSEFDRTSGAIVLRADPKVPLPGERGSAV